MGLVGGGFAGAMALSTLLSGRISDRIGPRHVIATSNLLLLISLVCLVVVDKQHWGYFAAYFLVAGATGAMCPSLIAWLTEYRHGPALLQRLVCFCLAWNLGMICGYAIGGQLFDIWGPALPMILAIGVLPLNFLLIFLSREDASITLTSHEEVTDSEDATTTLAGAFVMLSWVANVGGTFCMSIVIFLLPDLAVEIGMTSGLQGNMLAFSRAVVIATYLMMYVSQWWHFRFVGALASQGLAIAGLLVLAKSDSQTDLFLGLSLLSILPGYNYFASLYYSAAGSTAERRGTWCGIHEATLGLGLTLGSILGGWIGTYAGVRVSFVLAALVIAGLAAVQVVLWFRLDDARSEAPSMASATGRGS